MKRKTIVFAWLTALALGGCQNRNSVDPAPGEIISSVSHLQTFVLSSATDPRLPAPMAEALSVTATDMAVLEGMIAGQNLALSVTAADDPASFWNQLTAELGLKARLSANLLVRSYALVHVATFDGLVVGRDLRRGGLADHAVAAGAASEVLLYLFPTDATRIREAIAAQVKLCHGHGHRRIVRSFFLGRLVGQLVVLYGKADGSDAVFTGTPPTGDCIWTGVNPLLPLFGTLKTWITTSGAEFQPEPPLPCGSEQDLREVEDVYQASLARTPEQIAIVHKWADIPAPTIWNNSLISRIISHHLGTLASARAYAYLNVAMFDAAVSCWKTKYTYWTARPFHRRPGLVTVIPTPNFPSYPSGHATVSGAAGVVLGELFSSEKAFFNAEADEAALSRFWGGIHFHHDDNQGLVVGRKIGDKAVARMRRDRNHPLLALR